jgi:hypothetical protein
MPPLPTVEAVPQTAEEQLQLHPEEHIKRSAWHSYVERDGKVVEDAINYGEAFKQERVRERMPTPFGAQDARFQGGSAYQQGAGMGASTGPLPGSSQASQDYHLPTSQSYQDDTQHFATPSEPNPLIDTITNPWLWLGVGILMIAFFAAATI